MPIACCRHSRELIMMVCGGPSFSWSSKLPTTTTLDVGCWLAWRTHRPGKPPRSDPPFKGRPGLLAFLQLLTAAIGLMRHHGATRGSPLCGVNRKTFTHIEFFAF